ncbi:DUF1844 domain-containing protein [Candidatus Poribacteria bacterium]
MAQEEEKEVNEQVESEEEIQEENEEEVEQPQMELPPVNFESFIFGLYNTALFHLGMRDPETGNLIQNLPIARHTIDTLGMLQEKTKGNLTAPESNLMENLLYELRMNYLRAAKQAEAAPEEKPEAEEETTEPKAEEEKEEAEEAQETSDENS